MGVNSITESKSLKKIVNNAKSVGVIGSPSSTGHLNVDILESAVKQRLIGHLGVFNFNQDEKEHYALSQFTEITMKNTWSEDPTIRGLIRQKGSIDPITERQDVHLAQMTVSSVFSEVSNKIEPSILGMIPSTGTNVKLLNEDIMNSLFSDYKDELFYLGKAYGTEIRLPMWFKHFGTGKRGANEAYHLGVFGKTGSGKSILSLMIMLAYAKHEKMCVFVLDPQGEFSKKIRETPKLQELLKKDLKKEIIQANLHNLVLSGWDLFKKILIHSGFFKELGIHHETNQQQAANELVRIIQRTDIGQKKARPWDAYNEGVFENIWHNLPRDEILARIYSSQDLRNRVRSSFNDSEKPRIRDLWIKVANLFKYHEKSESIEIKQLVKEIEQDKGKFILIDLSEVKSLKIYSGMIRSNSLSLEKL